jgi:hypothetical protein
MLIGKQAVTRRTGLFRACGPGLERGSAAGPGADGVYLPDTLQTSRLQYAGLILGPHKILYNRAPGALRAAGTRGSLLCEVTKGIG